MDNLKMTSMDNIQENIKKIQQLFPNAVTEVLREGKPTLAIDFDILKQEMSGTLIDDKEERYQFTWPDKKKSILLANSPISATLRPCKEESVDFDNTQNLYIEGDNLDVLKLLQETYLGKVKMIYIDPPYNTGTDSLSYHDDFGLTDEEFIKIGGFFDDDGNRIYEGSFRENPESNGRFHTDWLNMIYPRLKIAKDLLTDDGVIFISIDDHEASNLRTICDNIFGTNNYIETFYIQVRFAEKSLNEKDDFQKLIEQVLIYAKDKHSFVPSKPYEEYDLSKFCWEIQELGVGEPMTLGGKQVQLFKPTEYTIKQVPFSINALKETWASGSVLKGNTSGKFFDKQLSSRIYTDGYGCMYKVYGIGEDGIGYRYFTGPKKEGATKGKFYSGVPLVRREEIANGSSRKYCPIVNFFDYSGDFGNISHEGGVVFRGGKKPVKMLKHFMSIANLKENDICLDFFSGSASFGHAVMDYNKEIQNKMCKFILVQIDAPFSENSDYVREGFSTICSLGKERLRRAGKTIKEESPLTTQNLDTGFRVLKLDSSNMKDVYYKSDAYTQDLLSMLEDNIKEDRSSLDLLFQVMLELGKPLSAKIEEKEIAGKHVFIVDENDLIACFDTNVTEEVVKAIAQLKPLYAVFRDSSLENDSANANLDQLFATYSPNTTRKVL